MKLALSNNQQTMSSREIGVLCSIPHESVLKTVRSLVDRGVVFGNETPYTHSQNGQQYPEFLLSFRDTMIVASGYSPELRAKVVDRWLELEADATKSTLPNFSNPAQAARAWAEQYEARQLAEATKAEIGSRREATAMNTASQAVKKVNRLEAELDQSKQYATIKRMGMIFHGQVFSWSLLKSASADLGLPPLAVFDANYGTVKAYHADAWREAYALEINELEAA